MTPLEQAILRTAAYFDMFSYPLTAWEIWKWLFTNAAEKVTSPQVADVLEKSPVLQDKLVRGHGMYALAGRDACFATRQDRYRLSLHKFKRARHYATVLRRLPFIRAVAVCNSLGLANARPESDIDLLLFTKPGHVWTTRLFAAGWAQLRKLRPRLGHRADTACLSFFITEDVGDLSNVRKPDDPYFTIWLATLVPLYDPHGLVTRLWQQNAWVADTLPNADARHVAAQRRVTPTWVQRLFEPLVAGRWIERAAEGFQQRRLPPVLRALANLDTRVVLNRNMLKFHDNDRRDAYAQRFHQTCERIGV